MKRVRWSESSAVNVLEPVKFVEIPEQVGIPRRKGYFKRVPALNQLFAMDAENQPIEKCW